MGSPRMAASAARLGTRESSACLLGLLRRGCVVKVDEGAAVAVLLEDGKVFADLIRKAGGGSLNLCWHAFPATVSPTPNRLCLHAPWQAQVAFKCGEAGERGKMAKKLREQ